MSKDERLEERRVVHGAITIVTVGHLSKQGRVYKRRTKVLHEPGSLSVLGNGWDGLFARRRP